MSYKSYQKNLCPAYLFVWMIDAQINLVVIWVLNTNAKNVKNVFVVINAPMYVYAFNPKTLQINTIHIQTIKIPTV